ncbi:MAG: carbohydrate ABC transporter permease [Bacillati bacterium ANGP1]|uniref:Carbohydrate ABC transporter permease n=1 Tax=Candidatus Segetimicrobium genomatis TaxID=2569760 RepID=A0A537IWK1_9BACT|nr:MAG: carbohydrate ABC transporter permease [Terrabacteria group bacterium ANGP1]
MRERAAGWRAQRRRDAWGRRVLLSVVVFALIVPLIWTLLASFQIKPEAHGWPPAWTLPPSAKSYAEVMTEVSGFPRVYATSLIVSITTTLLTIGTAFLAAYSLARWRFRGTRAVVQSFLVLASLPAMAYVIPLSDFTRELHLRDTFAGVALASAAVYAPLAVYILYGYLEQVPRSLEEIAHLEGARLFQIVWKVVVPAAAPGLAATAVLVFVLDWNLFLVPTALTLNHVKTIPVALSDFYTYERELEWSNAAAALTLSLLPVAALVALAHRILEQFSLNPTPRDP